jgi:hypothetical protein
LLLYIINWLEVDAAVVSPPERPAHLIPVFFACFSFLNLPALPVRFLEEELTQAARV